MTLELLEFVVVVSLSEFVDQDLTKPEFLKALFNNYSTTFYAEVPLSDEAKNSRSDDYTEKQISGK